MIMILLNCQQAPVQCLCGGWGRQIHIKGMVKEVYLGKWTVATTVTDENFPLLCLFPALPTDPPVAVIRQPYQNTWPGGERGQKPQCLLCGLPFLFSCLSVVLAESSVWGFFAVFELVASAFPRAMSRLQVALPSLTSLFSNLKGI